MSISNKASELTGLTYVGNTLFLHRQAVKAMKVRGALSSFIGFLAQHKQKVTLIANNCKTFDSSTLLRVAKSLNMLDECCQNIAGFIDTKLFFIDAFPNLASHTQIDLYSHFFQGNTYSAHGAVADVKALKELVLLFSYAELMPFSFTMEYALLRQNYLAARRLNYSSWAPLVPSVLSKGMAEKAAALGLTVSHLILAQERHKSDGVRAVLSEVVIQTDKPRVTRTKSCLDRICDYFEKNHRKPSNLNSLPKN